MKSSRPTFGTDGVRGVANSELTVELSVALGRALARHAGSSRSVLVGRDTRRSGPLLQAAFSAGAASAGLDVIDLGVLPTPAIAAHSALSGLPAAVVSASHNPFADNGIKLFGSDGRKLADGVEARIAEDLEELLSHDSKFAPMSGAEVGAITAHPAPFDAYLGHMLSRSRIGDLGGVKVVVDCANGAASAVAPLALERLGAAVTVINNVPDGTNINSGCGSTHPESLCAKVVETGAAIGLALDGDADRVIAVDEKGEVVDGDHLIAMLALDAHRQGELAGDTVVVTVMTNLGFRIAMEAAGLKVHQTKVGDRYVAEALVDNGWSLGGEQSGHIIFPGITTTGDGVLSGIFAVDLMRRAGKPLSELAAGAMKRLPQVLENVRVTKRGVEKSEPVLNAVVAESEYLGEKGRVLLRASGTEPLVRVMVEAESQQVATETCARLCEVVRAADGGD